MAANCRLFFSCFFFLHTRWRYLSKPSAGIDSKTTKSFLLAILRSVISAVASRQSRVLSEEEFLQFVFDSDDDIDHFEDDNASDNGDYMATDSDNDVKENDTAAQAENRCLLPPSKVPKVEEWQWKGDIRSENIIKHRFSGPPGVK